MSLGRPLENAWAALAYSRDFFIDAFFPLYCLGCETYGDWLCAECFYRLPRRLDQRCPLCLIPTPRGERCFACLDRSRLDGLFAASYYHSPLLSAVVHTCKYQFIPELTEVLGAFLVMTLERTEVPLPDLLVPVPLHEKRLRFRGFNQAELIAQEVSRYLVPDLRLPVRTNALVRVRKTKPQIKTRSREERLGNLKRAFAVTQEGEKDVRGKSLWLIDDVSTTGTTMNECAQALKLAGARSVFGIVLAR